MQRLLRNASKELPMRLCVGWYRFFFPGCSVSRHPVLRQASHVLTLLVTVPPTDRTSIVGIYTVHLLPRNNRAGSNKRSGTLMGE